MKEIGDTLKQKREARKFSLEFVNAQTHIPLKYITAMEEWNISVFPAEVYLWGSLRRYSKFLGLNGEDLIALYRRHAAEAMAAQKPVTVESDTKFRKTAAMILLAVVLAAAAGILTWTQRSAVLTYLKPKPRVLAIAPKPAVVKPAPVLAEPVKSGFTLEIKSVEKSWVKVSADGNKPFEGILEAGTSKKWDANNEFYVSVGYVPGVKVFINGKPFDVTVGAKQDVNSMTLSKADLERITKNR